MKELFQILNEWGVTAGVFGVIFFILLSFGILFGVGFLIAMATRTLSEKTHARLVFGYALVAVLVGVALVECGKPPASYFGMFMIVLLFSAVLSKLFRKAPVSPEH